MLENGTLEAAQLLPRLDTSVLDEPVPSLLVRLEGVGLPAGLVQRGHQLPPEALAGRVRPHEALQLTDEGCAVTERQPSVHASLDGGQTQLGEAHRLGGGDGKALELGQRLAAPPRQRVIERGARLPCVAGGERRTPSCDEDLEATSVKCVGLDLEPVPSADGPDRPARQGATKVRDVGLERLGRRAGWHVAPQVSDELACRDRLSGSQGQRREYRPLLGTADLDARAVHGHLERPEHPHLHAAEG